MISRFTGRRATMIPEHQVKPRVCFIGLDCADPRLVFSRLEGEMPAVTALRRQGVWCSLRSCHPPVTIPAWQVMMSGRDPGELGLYGFRNRTDYSYEGLSIATSRDVKVPGVWDYFREPEDHSIVLGVPGTYPPGELQGELVSCFLTPDTDREYTYPPELADEIRNVVGNYRVDVENFRSDEKERLVEDIHEMTRTRFTLFRHLLRTRPWNFAMMVEIGTDRIHHGFWRFFDPAHRFHEPDNPHRHVIRDYYRLIDAEIAETVRTITPSSSDVDETSTTVVIASDHGAQPLRGGFALNDWLRMEGYLVLKDEEFVPDSPGRVPFQPPLIDWQRTRVWGEGGYFGRLFFNIEGREPHGRVPPLEVESLVRELKEKLEALPDDQGGPMGNTVHRPSDLYSQIRGIPPDLLVYFGNLAWRSIGSLNPSGTGTIDPADLYTPENDTGPDDANHDWDGIFVAAPIGPSARSAKVADRWLWSESGKPHSGNGESSTIRVADILDIAPTIHYLMGREVPDTMGGRILFFD